MGCWGQFALLQRLEAFWSYASGADQRKDNCKSLTMERTEMDREQLGACCRSMTSRIIWNEVSRVVNTFKHMQVMSFEAIFTW